MKKKKSIIIVAVCVLAAAGIAAGIYGMTRKKGSPEAVNDSTTQTVQEQTTQEVKNPHAGQAQSVISGKWKSSELAQQKALAQTLLAQEKITREVYNNLVASLDKAAQMKTTAVNNEEKENNERQNRRSGGGGRSSGGSSSANNAKKAADELKKAVQAGEDALLKIIEDSLERQRKAEMLSYQRKLKELQDALAKTKSTQVQMRTALNNQIEGLEAEHQRKLHDLKIAGMERRQKADADFIALHLETVN